jgi:hypothetical protein
VEEDEESVPTPPLMWCFGASPPHDVGVVIGRGEDTPVLLLLNSINLLPNNPVEYTICLALLVLMDRHDSSGRATIGRQDQALSGEE